MSHDFIEVQSDRGPMLIRKDKIACIYGIEDNKKCIIIPSHGDLVKICILEAFEQVAKQIYFNKEVG